MASPSLENPELARNVLSDKLAQLSELDTYELNLILSVYLNQALELFKVYGAGIFPEKDWLLRAAEIKQVINLADFAREYANVNLIFSEMFSLLYT